MTRTITSANIDRLRLTFGVQALVQIHQGTGIRRKSARWFRYSVRAAATKTSPSTGHQLRSVLASVVVGRPPRPFNIRMRRMTPDSTTDQLQNKTLWSSYTEIIDAKQCYPTRRWSACRWIQSSSVTSR
ncbi:TipJ family phage tail tip protein [Shigella flexneri]